MDEQVNPKRFGLPKTLEIQKTDDQVFAIITRRKSRIAMKDAKSIIKKANKIKAVYPKAKIKIKTNAPVCSKTEAFLKENEGILFESI